MPPRAALLVDPDVLHDYLGAVADPGGAAYAVHQSIIGEVGPNELVDPSGAIRKLWPSLSASQRALVNRILAPHGARIGSPFAAAVPWIEGGAELVTPEAAAAAAAAGALVSAGTGLAARAVRSYLNLRSVPWWVWIGILYLLVGGRRR